MNKKLLNALESLPFFTKEALSTLERASENTIHQNIKRWVKNGIIIRLKNGLFVTKTFADRFMHDPSFVELIANRLTQPSYLSLEYVLQRHNILTEGTYTITSVTLKSTRQFTNTLGTFQYHTVGKKLYYGFEQKRFGKNIIYEATLPKALFDYLYLRLPFIDPSDMSAIEELRLNWPEVGENNFNAFEEMVKKSGIKKFAALVSTIKKNILANFYDI